jgi:adenylate cyclase
LKMQDEIVTRLARAMQIQLVAVDIARVTRTRPGNLDAEDLALRCQAGVYNSVGPAEFAAALSLCDRALNIDNGNVLALSNLAMMHIIPVVEARSTDPQADIRQADELVSRALALDPNFYAAHFAKAYVLMGQNRTQEAVILSWLLAQAPLQGHVLRFSWCTRWRSRAATWVSLMTPQRNAARRYSA